MSLSSFQHDVVRLLFAKDFTKHLDALGHDERARKIWQVHRRMARSRLRDIVEHSFPRLVALLDAGAEGEPHRGFEATFDAWLDAAPPRTPYYREVAGELAAYLQPDRGEPRQPRAGMIADLARYEWALLEVSYAHEEEGAGEVREVGEISFERPAVLTPAHRILRLGASVHRLSLVSTAGAARLSDLDAVVAGDYALLLYRDAVSHETRVLELSAPAAAILEEIAPGLQTVVEAVHAAAARAGFVVDADLVSSLGDLVADLVERGVWLGSALSLSG